MRRHDQNPTREEPVIYEFQDICAELKELKEERCLSRFKLPCLHLASSCLVDYVPGSYLIRGYNCQILGLPQRFKFFGGHNKFT